MSTYDQTFTKYDNKQQIHVEQFKERHLLRIKKSMLNDAKGRGALGYRGEGGIGVLTNIDYILCCLKGPYAATQAVYAAPRVLSRRICNCRRLGIEKGVPVGADPPHCPASAR
jgi:hypothetical protein